MENKKSFLLYADYMTTIMKLSDEQAGKLFKHIMCYVNDLSPSFEKDDLVVEIAFEPIKQQLKRDLTKRNEYIKMQKVNGKKWGRPRTRWIESPLQKPKETQKTHAFINKPKKPVNVNVNVNVNEIDTVAPPKLQEVISYQEEKKLYTVDGEFFFDYYTEHKRRDKNWEPVKSRKLKMQTWHKKNCESKWRDPKKMPVENQKYSPISASDVKEKKRKEIEELEKKLKAQKDLQATKENE